MKVPLELQTGKAFRNEIVARHYIPREFEQMCIQEMK
jgi:glycyl-tRNA synthetase (class II)